MKTLRTLALATLLAASSLAQAVDIWTAPNKAGGNMVLTSRPCPVPNSAPLLEAYTYTEGGQTMKGCWGTWDDLVHIVWSNGNDIALEPEKFSASPNNRRTKPQPAAASKKSLDL